MAYKLAEEDKLCGVIYPTYEGFKPIPKATCEMLESKCDKTEIIVKCKDNQSEEDKKPESQSGSASASASESNSTSESQASTSESTSESTTSTSESKSESTSAESTSVSESSSVSESTSTTESTTTSESTSVSTSESTSASSSTENSNTPVEPKPTPEPQPEPVPTPVLTNEELDTIVSGKLSTNTTLGNYMVNQNNIINLIGEATPEDIEAYKKEITDKVGDIPELKDYTVEVLVNKIPGDNAGDKATGAPLYTKVVKITKPNGEVYQSEPMSIGTTTETNIDLLEALPRVEDKFSKIITKDGQVVEVPEVSNEDKRAFEDKIINDLKAKLPEGTVVEAVLEGPKYEKGSEVLSGKTNYVLNVRTTLNGVVSEQTYNVPHTEEAPKEEPEAPDENIEIALSNIHFGIVTYDGDLIIDIRDNSGSDLTDQVKESDLPRIGERLKNSVEESLNKGLTGDNVYKVNDFTVKMNYKVGEHKPWSAPVFSFTAKITKPNGEVVTKEGAISSGSIDTL
jgi:serine-rich adhesin, platelet-type